VVYYGTWKGDITEALVTENRIIRTWKANDIEARGLNKISFLKV
jgi:hypothetical protein